MKVCIETCSQLGHILDLSASILAMHSENNCSSQWVWRVQEGWWSSCFSDCFDSLTRNTLREEGDRIHYGGKGLAAGRSMVAGFVYLDSWSPHVLMEWEATRIKGVCPCCLACKAGQCGHFAFLILRQAFLLKHKWNVITEEAPGYNTISPTSSNLLPICIKSLQHFKSVLHIRSQVFKHVNLWKIY